MMKTRVGLLGAGYILDAHATALTAIPQVTLHAVCDSALGRAKAAASRYGIGAVFGSIDDLAGSDCDVVHVLLPPAQHIPAARTLIEAGKSVFLEKPMGLNAEACADLCALAQAKGVVVGVNHNFLFTPGYEAMRARIKAGELGRIDHLSANWHFALPILQFGPFDAWMLAAPANLLFELGSHLAAFVIDLVGSPLIVSAVAGNPLELPAGQKVFRGWSIQGQAGSTTVQMSISTTAGQADRYIRVRGRGQSAQLDFGRDIGWQDGTTTDNPIFDSYVTAQSAGARLLQLARRDRKRRLGAALRKRPDANPFEESIFRSINRFYQGGVQDLDPRHDGEFATQVIRLCETAAIEAGAGSPSTSSVSVPVPRALSQPRVLVVGGTGFIGRRLVRQLCEKGIGVRVLTRNVRAAAIELGDLPVELIAGSHGNPQTAASALAGVRAVYHLAKCEGKRWQDYVDGDIEPTRVLAEAALTAGVERFIYTGTIASYASGNPHDRIDNLTPVDPAIDQRNHYARSKAACEALLQDLQQRRGLGLIILRPGIVIGPGTPPAHLGVGRFSSETRLDFWGSGQNFLPFVLVDDVADALAKALERPDLNGKTLLVTSPPLLTARDYVVEVARCMGSAIDARPRSAWRYWVADLVKEVAKNAVRHPNRRWPTLHDSRCMTHSARYDARMTEVDLDWHPVSEREQLVSRGICDAVAWFMR